MLSYSFVIIYLSLIIHSLSSVPIRTQESAGSFIKNHEEFIPTNEWQTVKEGQAIPAGLHVRLNLQTGIREAKLLDNTETEPSSNDLIPISTGNEEQERISKQNLERAFANIDFSKDDVPTDEKHEETIRTKFRPYDELKKDFESMNMKIQTDYEILTDLIKQLNQTDNDENRKTILTDLEYYLHQYDNAVLFADMNGLELLMKFVNITNTNKDIRQLTCLVLGAAFQGNPKVQLKGLDLGYVQYLLRLLSFESDDNMKYRLLFTLSTLLRNCPQLQMNFLEYGGVETIMKVVDQTDSLEKVKTRAIDLMNDLICEKDQATDEKRTIYENIHIRDELVKHDWCSRISHRLRSADFHDFNHIEKTLDAMIPLSDACQTTFVSLLPILDKLNDVYIKETLNKDSIHFELFATIEKVRMKFKELSSADL